MSNKNSIIVKRYDAVEFEMKASQPIRPGSLVRITPIGLVPNDIGVGDIPAFIALENSSMGKGVEDMYGAGEMVRVVVARPGDIFNLCWDGGTNTPTVGMPVRASVETLGMGGVCELDYGDGPQHQFGIGVSLERNDTAVSGTLVTVMIM